MPVPSGGAAANDNRSTGDRPCLRLDLAPDAWSATTPAAEMVAWIEDGWCGPVEICPASDSRPMPTGPD